MPGRNKGTDTIHLIHKPEIPDHRWKDVAYTRIVVNEQPQKAEVNITRLTYGGSNLKMDMDLGTPTASLLTVKILLNSVISTPGTKFMAIDIKDFYLNTPLERPEFIRLELSNFPEDVIQQYNLRESVDSKGFIYAKITRGMYGLPHAGVVAQKLLEKWLEKEHYFQSKTTPGFWKYKWRPISFSLIVHDFGVKYVGEEHANHLLAVLRENYDVSAEWQDNKYNGINLDLDCDQRKSTCPSHAIAKTL